MFRHVAIFRWREGTSAEQVQAVREGLAGLPSRIPQVRTYAFGEDAGGMAGHWDFAVVADFDDREGYRAYAEHPIHRRVIEERIAPIRAERAFLQFEVE